MLSVFDDLLLNDMVLGFIIELDVICLAHILSLIPLSTLDPITNSVSEFSYF